MDPQTQVPPLVDEQTQPAPPAPQPDVRQQVVEHINGGKNVLVTVGTDPNVDELASALGLTFMLNKLGKHVTAVFSGQVPAAMEFLKPEGTFEDSVDSLRDFIIALDKEKADKLRYKVEDDVVKIFITPYKTILSEKDLDFSQGDFNVDVVIALGVEKREELDKAIIAHGRILHDAVVVTINASQQKSGLGSVDWVDSSASSVSEMLVGLAEVLGAELIDEQVSTALLTGIVAQTNRFSNEKTSPKVMSIAAQLMAAGANQQLIATNLRQEGMLTEPVRAKETSETDDDGEMVLDHQETDEKAPSATTQSTKGASAQDSKKPKTTKKVAPPKASKPVGQTKAVAQTEPLNEKAADLEKQVELPASPTAPPEPVATDQSLPDHDDSAGTATTQDDTSTAAAATIKEVEPPTEVTVPSEPVSAPTEVVDVAALPALPAINPDPVHEPLEKPTFGGSLNATTAEAEDAREQEAARGAGVNNVALDHNEPATGETAEALEAAREAVEAAADSEPFDPANRPLEAINSVPLPTVEPAGGPQGTDTAASGLQLPPAPVDNFVAAPLTPAEEPDPVSSFMQPHMDTPPGQVADPNMPTDTSLPPKPATDTGLPPMPPLPTAAGGDLPPLPPLPGQAPDPTAAFQPQINPGFMQDLPQSQNAWTEAGNEMAAKQADKADARQAKMDQMNQQYDTAVDRNREMQGLPPLNDPNGSGLPPLPPLPPAL